MDKRAKVFFADEDGVGQILSAHGVNPQDRIVRFIHADYNALELAGTEGDRQ